MFEITFFSHLYFLYCFGSLPNIFLVLSLVRLMSFLSELASHTLLIWWEIPAIFWGPKRLPGFLTKLEEYVKLIRSKSSSISQEIKQEIYSEDFQNNKENKDDWKKLSRTFKLPAKCSFKKSWRNCFNFFCVGIF